MTKSLTLLDDINVVCKHERLVDVCNKTCEELRVAFVTTKSSVHIVYRIFPSTIHERFVQGRVNRLFILDP